MSNIHYAANDQIRLARDLMIELDALGLADDEEAVQLSVESELNLESVADEVLKCLGEDEALLTGIKELQARLAARKKRIEARVDAYKSLASRVLDAARQKKIERPGGTISLAKKPPSLAEVDEAQVPSKFWVEKDPVLDRRAILAALKDGEEVPGASIKPTEMSVRINT